METRTVTVSLGEVIDRDIEGFLDLLEELFFAEDDADHRGILRDIHYKISGVNAYGEIHITVTGDIEDDDDVTYEPTDA